MMSIWECLAICFAVVLISTASLCVEGLPILGPDLNSCQPVFPPERTDALDCCFVDTSKPIKDFKFNLDLPMRVRRPVHKLDNEYVRKYERAVELMKALPPEDPRSFTAQARLHCTYCAKAYNRFNSSQVMKVHKNWLVQPFHRWYVYFYERILAQLVGDDTFAIPYWAWDVQNEDNPPANVMPSIFVNPNSSLYDAKRSKQHQPPARVDFEHPSPIGNKDPDLLLLDNYYRLWRSMIGQVKTPEAFYGGKLSLEAPGDTNLAGVFEVGPHLGVHTWTGDSDSLAYEDMGSAHFGSEDPIFWAHHSQVDRLWDMWKSWGGRDIEDPDWLDTEFLLYDENADLVRVNVRDSLNLGNLRVTYEHIDIDWADFTPKSIRDVDPKYAEASIPRHFWREMLTGGSYRYIAMALGSFFQKETNEVKVALGGVRRAAVTSQVTRIEVLTSEKDLSMYDEVLVISGVVEGPFDASVVMNIFLELPEADENTVKHCAEFLGNVVVDSEELRDGMGQIVTPKFVKTIGISQTLEILNITRQKSLAVTFVPAWDPKHDSDVSVRVTDLRVEMKRVR